MAIHSRKTIIFFVSAFFVFSSTAYIDAQQDNNIVLKLSGGLSRLTGTDYEAVTKGWNYLGRISAEAAGGILTTEGEPFDWGWETAGEIIFHLNPRFAISGGVGYIEGKFSNKRTTTFEGVTTGSSGTDFKAKAIPVTAGLAYAFPLSGRSRVSIGAGAGYYFTSFSTSSFRETDSAYRQDTFRDGHGGSFGMHGGIAFEYDLSKNVAILIEGFGRYAKISGFEGTTAQSDTNNNNSSMDGTFYTHEHLVWTGEWLTRVAFGSEPPSGDEIRNARDYEVDFSGFAFRLGLKIRLF